MSIRYNRATTRYSDIIGNGPSIDRLDYYVKTILRTFNTLIAPKTPIVVYGPERTGRTSAILITIRKLQKLKKTPPRTSDKTIEWIEGFDLEFMETEELWKLINKLQKNRTTIIIKDSEILKPVQQRTLIRLMRIRPEIQFFFLAANDYNFIDALRYNSLFIPFNLVDISEIEELLDIRTKDLEYDTRKLVRKEHIEALAMNAEGRPGVAIRFANEFIGLKPIPSPDDIGHMTYKSFSKITSALYRGRFDQVMNLLSTIHPRIFIRRITEWTYEQYKEYMTSQQGSWCNMKIASGLAELFFVCENALAHKADWNVLKMHFIHRWNKIMEEGTE